MEILQGKATVLGRDTETHGHVGGSGGHVSGSIQSFRTVTIDIEGRTVNIKHKEPIIVMGGDQVVVAGKRKSNGLQGYCLANRSRSTRNDAPATQHLVLGGLLVLLGIPLTLLLVGLILIGFGGYFIHVGLQLRKANALIDEALVREAPATVT